GAVGRRQRGARARLHDVAGVHVAPEEALQVLGRRVAHRFGDGGAAEDVDPDVAAVPRADRAPLRGAGGRLFARAVILGPADDDVGDGVVADVVQLGRLE